MKKILSTLILLTSISVCGFSQTKADLSLPSNQGLPAGITLNASGVLQGTTNANPGNYTFTVGVCDSGVPQQCTTKQFTLLVIGPIAITTTTVPNAVDGIPYSFPFAVTGGVPPYVNWTVQ